MRALIALPRRSLAIWMPVFFSSTLYFLLLMLGDTFHLPSPPEIVVASLFYLIPPVALLACGAVVWSSSMTVDRKVGAMLVTLFGMLLQFSVILLVFVVATGYAPTQ